MPGLRETQQRFAAFLLAEEAAGQRSLPALKHAAAKGFTDQQRLQVYRNNYHISLRAALAGVYPVVQKLVGENCFQLLAREYVSTQGSDNGNLHHYGALFGEFLRGVPGLATLPYLGDVARLEWARHQVFHTDEFRQLKLDALAVMDQEQLAHIQFKVSHVCRLLRSDYPVVKIWQLNQDTLEQETVSLDEGGVQYVVQRHEHDIAFHLLADGPFAMLASLVRGVPFTQACEAALAVDEKCDIAAALHYLVRQKILVDFLLPPGVGQQQRSETGERT